MTKAAITALGALGDVSTVATLLSRLEKKGVVTHRKEGRQFVYRATVSRGDVRSSMVRGLTRTLFGGDPAALVQHLVVDHDVDDLGPEPLGNDFDGRYLWQSSRKRKLAVKQFIMNANIVVGVGNIYASEALFLAGINPKRAAGRIARHRYDALADAIDMDPVDLRLKNISLYSQARDGQPLYTSTGLQDCLAEGARAFGWQQAKERIAAAGNRGVIRSGVGMAGALWIAGGGRPPGARRRGPCWPSSAACSSGPARTTLSPRLRPCIRGPRQPFR